MDVYAYIGLAIVIIILFLSIAKNKIHTKKVYKNNTYIYLAKSLPMTKTESEFFRTLEATVGERYYVFPQVHLSAILDHKIKGQDWHFAFRHINGKSVDFVLCDKGTLRPTYAIELDDYTHDRRERQKRDREVERILEEADLPLVRFTNKNVSSSEIIHALSNAYI